METENGAMTGDLRVLVVDDSRELVETFRDILELLGFKTTTANQGSEAVALARKIHFDVVLLDLMMPGMNGFETMQQIQSFSSDTSFMVITAYDGSEQVDQVKRAGAIRVFSKPLIVEDVVRALTDFRARRTAPAAN